MTGTPPERDHAFLRVATWNVHKAVGSDGRRSPERIAAVVGEIEPRILVLQEADRRFPRAPIFAHNAFGPLRPTATFGRFLGWHGNAILARGAETLRITPFTLPGGEPRGALVVDLRLDDGREIRVCAAHLGLLRRHRRLQIARILTILTALPPLPTILAGDLNERLDGDGSPLAALDGVLAPAAPHNTFPAAFPLLPLDRIRTCGRIALDDLFVHATPLARQASDHLPLVAKIRFPQQA